MKKLISLMLTCVLVLSVLSGCASSVDTSSGLTVALVVAGRNNATINDFLVGYKQGTE